MKDINKGAPLPPVQALITRAAQTSCSPLGPRLPDLSSQKISKQIQRKGGGVGRVNINIKAKNRKQSAARGPGPSSAPPPRRAPSPAHLPRRLGRRLPPFPLAPSSRPPPGTAARGSPAAICPPEGPARRGGDTEPGPALRGAARLWGLLGRCDVALASPCLARRSHRAPGSSSPGGAAGAGDGARMAREPPRFPPPTPAAGRAARATPHPSEVRFLLEL